MKTTVILLLGSLILASPACAEETDLLQWAENFFQQKMSARYMETGEGQEITIDGWEGYPTKLHQYTVIDKAARGIRLKRARVVLLDPSPTKLARWVVTAVKKVDGEPDRADIEYLCKQINSASNAQFPVAGIVYEDKEGNGIFKSIAFRDGVAVRLKDVPHYEGDPLDEDKLDLAISSNTPLEWLTPSKNMATGKYARIASTTREEYCDYDSQANVKDFDWLEVVRLAYQEAWNSDENKLITAWYRSNKVSFPPVPSEDKKYGKNGNAYLCAEGHPTVEEKASFLYEVKSKAVELSRKYSVPASALVGMSIHESCYGYTRTGFYANNHLGIKRWGEAKEDSYQLVGQPDEDRGKVLVISELPSGESIFDEGTRKDNRYRIFSSKADCMGYLVEMTFLNKNRPAYHSAVQLYRDRVKQGVSRPEASRLFLKELGDAGYCHFGGDYYMRAIARVIEEHHLDSLDQ
jgi:hypothetical protein